MSKLDPHKPIPYALSQWDSRTEVFYKCSECGQSFKMFGNKELFCHNCGLRQDWSDSPQNCSQEFKDKYEDLVYNKHAHIRGSKPEDTELRRLLFDFYSGTKR